MSKIIPSIISTSTTLTAPTPSVASYTQNIPTYSEQVVQWTSSGVFSYTIPYGVTEISCKMWGAGGGGSWINGSTSGAGGSGAFAESTYIKCTPGDNYEITVGAGGGCSPATGVNGSSAGGTTVSGNASGGSANFTFQSSKIATGGGGSASSLHKFTGTNYVLVCLAGAGGGNAPGGYPGSGGGSGGSTSTLNGATGAGVGGGFANGNAYITNATTTGSTSMSLNNGNGASYTQSFGGGGGGGGGYGGGNAGGNSNGGGGGNSYVAGLNSLIIAGNSNGVAPNTSDTDYVSPAGTSTAGGSGNAGMVSIRLRTYQTSVGGFYMSNTNAIYEVKRLKTTDSEAITASTTNTYTGSLVEAPTFTANTSSALTISSHNYLEFKNPVVTVTGTGSLSITNAAAMQFDASASTHKALSPATTKTTPGGVDAWIKVNINGTVYSIPAYLSQTA